MMPVRYRTADIFSAHYWCINFINDVTDDCQRHQYVKNSDLYRSTNTDTGPISHGSVRWNFACKFTKKSTLAV